MKVESRCPLPPKRTRSSEQRWPHEKTGTIRHLGTSQGPCGGPGGPSRRGGTKKKEKEIQKEGILGAKAKSAERRGALGARVGRPGRGTDVTASGVGALFRGPGVPRAVSLAERWLLKCCHVPRRSGEWDWRDVGLSSRTRRHRNCPSSPKARYVNDKLQVTDPLLRIRAKLLLLKPKEKTKQKPSRSR